MMAKIGENLHSFLWDYGEALFYLTPWVLVVAALIKYLIGGFVCIP